MRRCPRCDSEVPHGATACPRDGAPLGARAAAAGPVPSHELSEAQLPTVLEARPGPAPGQPPLRPAAKAGELAGTRLGEYDVLELLGEGGMGMVYRGVQPLIGKQVAIKVLRPELAEDPLQVKRLLDEARAVNAARHPGLIDIFSFGQTPEGAQYFVMELLHGQSLEERLRRVGRMPAFEALPILEQVLAALAAAHSAGVVHRDLKPSNIFLSTLPDRSEVVKVLDFGLAKLSGEGGSGTARGSLQNAVVGTPAYMAPEQALGQPVVPRSDLYAIGVMAYELLTGQVPFRGGSHVETMVQQCERPPRPPSSLEPSVPPALEQLVLRLLAKQPEDRPASAAEVRRELQRLHRALFSAETRLRPAPHLAQPITIEESAPLVAPRLGSEPTHPAARRRRSLAFGLCVALAAAATLVGTLWAMRWLR